ncbi:MAG: CsgG/HfaB family protein [Candidatus Marinimicrobia bacterium]|nr:CsgG/HfaB family protein [Candidatus Neomarinimicrobiota bacterium]
MGKRHTIIAVGLTILLLSINACTFFSEYAKLERNAREAYGRAEYDTAVFMLARSLQIRQDYEKSQILLADAFLMANRTHDKRIEEIKAENSKFKYDILVREYQSLVNLHDAVKVLPPIRHPKTAVMLEFKIIDYSNELNEAREMAAESHYAEGNRLSQSASRDEQKAAAKQFKKALSFVPDYRDADARYDSSRKAGIKRIAVFPFEDMSAKTERFGATAEFVLDQMVSAIISDPSATEFLELISRDELDRVIAEQKLALSGLVNEATAVEVGEILGVHEIMTGKITQIIYTPVQTIHRDYRESARVVIKTEKYEDKDGKTKTRKIYGDVEARIREYTRTTKAEIRGSYKIVDVRTSKLIRSESFKGQSDFEAKWITFRGDERALSRTSKKLAAQGETIAPVADEMVNRAASDLANSLTATLKIYAR